MELKKAKLQVEKEIKNNFAECDILEIRENKDNYFFRIGIKNEIIIDIPIIIVSKKDGGIDYLTIPPIENINTYEKSKIINKKESKVIDFVKNPIIIKNSNNYETISEKILQKLILEDIENFMKELGNSFCFVGSEYKIRIGKNFNYIDL